MQTNQETKKHVFELAGLGPAPYKFLGAQRKTYQACPGAPIQPGGTCDYCPAAITFHFHFRAANGAEFKVGSECAKKGFGDNPRAMQIIETAERRAKKAAAAERAEARKGRLIRFLFTAAGRKTLRAQPHPLKWRASQGDTALDWAVWMLRHSGQGGTLKVIRGVNKIVGKKVA